MAINPLQPPINYMGSQINLSEQFSQFGEALEKRKARVQLEDQQKQYVTDFTATINEPSQKAFANLMAKHGRSPAMVSAIQNATKTFGEDRVKNEFNQGMEISMALENDNPEIAKQRVKEIITAKTNSKEPLGIYSQISDLLDKGSVKEAQAGVNMALSILNPEQFKKTVEARVSAADVPTKRKILEAEAIQKGIDADYAPFVAEAGLRKLLREGISPSVQEAIDFQNLTPSQKELFSSIQILKKPPAAVTNVNVTSLEKTGQQELAKLMPDLYNQSNSAAAQLNDIPRYRDALDKAIIGPLADQRLTMAKVAQAIGFQNNKQGIEASRTLIQGLSEMTLNSRSLLQGQGAITGPEQDLLAKAKSGEVNFTKDELKIIFDVAERASREQYKKSTNLLKSASKESPTAQMFLDNVTPVQAPRSANSVVVGGKTYTRPANFDDAQWQAYKQQVGAQ
jgi:hypothetical protein